MPLEAFILQHHTRTSWLGRADAFLKGDAQHTICPLGCQQQHLSPPPSKACTAGMACSAKHTWCALISMQETTRTCNASTIIHLQAAPAIPVAAALRVKGLARLFVQVGVERHHLILIIHAPACTISMPLAIAVKLCDATFALQEHHRSPLSVPLKAYPVAVKVLPPDGCLQRQLISMIRPCRQLAQAVRVNVVSEVRKLQKHTVLACPRQCQCGPTSLLKQAVLIWPQLVVNQGLPEVLRCCQSLSFRAAQIFKSLQLHTGQHEVTRKAGTSEGAHIPRSGVTRQALCCPGKAQAAPAPPNHLLHGHHRFRTIPLHRSKARSTTVAVSRQGTGSPTHHLLHGRHGIHHLPSSLCQG